VRDSDGDMAQGPPMTTTIIDSAKAYRHALLSCYRIIGQLCALPLDELHAQILRAETLGPILDPTLYRDKADALRQDKQIVEALLAVRKALPTDMVRVLEAIGVVLDRVHEAESKQA